MGLVTQLTTSLKMATSVWLLDGLAAPHGLMALL